MMKINNLWGDLTDTSARKEALEGTRSGVHLVEEEDDVLVLVVLLEMCL